MASAILEERRVAETKVQLSPLDLDQVYEDLEGGRAFLRDERFDPGEELTVGETGESGGPGACRGTRRTGGARIPGRHEGTR